MPIGSSRKSFMWDGLKLRVYVSIVLHHRIHMYPTRQQQYLCDNFIKKLGLCTSAWSGTKCVKINGLDDWSFACLFMINFLSRFSFFEKKFEKIQSFTNYVVKNTFNILLPCSCQALACCCRGFIDLYISWLKESDRRRKWSSCLIWCKNKKVANLNKPTFHKLFNEYFFTHELLPNWCLLF